MRTAPPAEAPAAATRIGVRYLTGYACADDGSTRAEWPPHPARLFMALVAAHHDGDGVTEPDPAERRALLWMEDQDPPDVQAAEAVERPAVETYVPPNDFAAPAKLPAFQKDALARAMNVLPERRTQRQPRYFPRCRPHHDTAWFAWAEACPEPEALANLCGRVSRLGHSASLVQIWASSETEAAPEGAPLLRWSAAGHPHRGPRLRVPRPEALTYLEAAFNREAVEEHLRLDAGVRDTADAGSKRKAKDAYESATGIAWHTHMAGPDRARPRLLAAEVYTRVQQRGGGPAGTAFDPDLLVYTLSPVEEDGRQRLPRLSPQAGLTACEVFRKAALHRADDPIPEELSGHRADGGPTTSPHAAWFPLIFCGHPQADGRLMGLAVALPRDFLPQDRERTLAALAAVDHLTLGRLGRWRLEASPWNEHRGSLRSDTWSGDPRGGHLWGTATPAAPDRYPKGRSRAARENAAAGLFADACERLGLPRPRRVRISETSPHAGAPAAREWPALRVKGGAPRPRFHAILTFDELVRGPLLLGAGRFRGHGVCRPLPEGAAS